MNVVKLADIDPFVVYSFLKKKKILDLLQSLLVAKINSKNTGDKWGYNADVKD